MLLEIVKRVRWFGDVVRVKAILAILQAPSCRVKLKVKDHEKGPPRQWLEAINELNSESMGRKEGGDRGGRDDCYTYSNRYVQ